MKSVEVPQYEVGSRIFVSGERGTIMYIGEVLNTEGVWLGIDWDNPARGKHDGTQMGIRYFTASHPTSGSFVRPKKVSTGITLLEAIENRYGEITDGTAGLDLDKINEVQREMKAKFFEVVGAEKLNKQQSNFRNLQTVVLHGTTVSCAGPPSEILDRCPNIRELHLGNTLLSSWRTIYEIVSQLKQLSILNVSSNRLRVDDLEAETFSSLTHLIMGKLNYTWDDVLRCFSFMLNAETVQVPFNDIRVLRVPPEHVFTRLANLDLEGNQFESWGEINKLGKIKTLKSMNLRACGLKEINFPSPDDSETDLFENLESLALSNNLFDDWVHISELDKLRCLVDLKFKDNPILEKESLETNHQLLIARIRKLEKINGAIILPEDRRGSEVDYHKRYGLEWLGLKDDEAKAEFLRRHPCYKRFLEKFGPPDINELRMPNTSLRSKLIQIEIFSPDHKDKSYLKKVPYNISVQKLAGLTQRLFNTGCEMPKLTCIHFEGSKVFEVPIDNDMKQLDFYSIRNGDKISVRW
ncbi:UNVERIFIED_CONTAM: hypothetical protein PYX00_006466 [Menopon gallinae]|uniref:Tubulin-specific chaperone E n=1 Tax=Menopon gallinae TaxID=328185 RepID=A0AAW2HVI1_9NEOP